MSRSRHPQRDLSSGRLPIRPLAAGLLVLATAAAGCGSGHPARLPVTGTVTFRGQTVAEATVSFLSQTSPIAWGSTDQQGRFQLTTFDANDGAAAGSYTVTIIKRVKVPSEDVPGALKFDKGPNQRTKEIVIIASFLPDIYGDARHTPLSAVVAAGKNNDFTFALTDESLRR
ncbi:MAG: hypothetical protein ACLQLG_02620 [Thermoguttaceae bacterium]